MEVTAARMLVGGKRSAKSGLVTQAGRRVPSEPWFSQPVKPIRRPKKTTEKERNCHDVSVKLFQGSLPCNQLRRSAPEAREVEWPRTVRRRGRVNAAATIRRIGDDWVGIGMRENWAVWLRLTLRTQFTFRRNTKPFAVLPYFSRPVQSGGARD